MVGSNRQRCRYQRWSVIHRDGGPERSAGGGFSTIRSQNSRALGRVAYVNSVHGCGSPRRPRAEREVPVQEEQRGETLLPVERLEPSRRSPRRRRSRDRSACRLSRLGGEPRGRCCGCRRRADCRVLGRSPAGSCGISMLAIVRCLVAALLEHASERRRVALHACDSSRSSGSSGESFSGRSSSRYGSSASSIASR